MKELKGKCKKCLGCNRLNDENFEGTNECDFYTKESRNWFLIIVAIITLISISFIIYKIYIFMNLLCRG